MKKIEVGMMVEIVDHREFREGRQLIGHIGRVLRLCDIHPGNWLIEGAERDPADGVGISFPPRALRPIEDDNASWDAEVWEQIGWKPESIEA
jgi:hypothetical protein